MSGAELRKCLCPLGLGAGVRRLKRNRFFGRHTKVNAKNSKFSATSCLQALFCVLRVEWRGVGHAYT